MANTRDGLIEELRNRGLTPAQAEEEVQKREAEAQRIVREEGVADKAAAMKKARTHLFAPGLFYVKGPRGGQAPQPPAVPPRSASRPTASSRDAAPPRESTREPRSAREPLLQPSRLRQPSPPPPEPAQPEPEPERAPRFSPSTEATNYERPAAATPPPSLPRPSGTGDPRPATPRQPTSGPMSRSPFSTRNEARPFSNSPFSAPEQRPLPTRSSPPPSAPRVTEPGPVPSRRDRDRDYDGEPPFEKAAPIADDRPTRAPREPGAPGSNPLAGYLAWTTSGPPARLAIGIGLPLAILLVLGYVLLFGGNEGDSFGQPPSGSIGSNSNQSLQGLNPAAALAATQVASAGGGAAASGGPAALSAETITYVNTMQPLLFNYSVSLSTIAQLVATPKAGDAAWSGQVDTALKGIKDNSAKVRAIKPSSCLNAAHANLIKAVEALDKGADSLADVAKGSNTGAIATAGQQLASASPMLNQATLEIARVRC